MGKSRLFAYCRVSTRKQAEKETIKNQELEINSYLRSHPTFEVAEWFRDDGVSAFKDRPEYNEMMRRVGEVDGIIINKLSRIGRSLKQLVSIVEKLKNDRKLFIVVNDNVDTSTPQGEFFFQILAAMQQYEAALIKERMAEGVRRAREEDAKTGHNRFGRPKIKLTTAERAEVVGLYTKRGWGTYKIASEFRSRGRTLSASTIRRLLVGEGVELRDSETAWQMLYQRRKRDIKDRKTDKGD